MTLEVFGHPFSSYTWKALIALYEKGLTFKFRKLGPDEPDNGERFAALAPFGKFPLLIDGAHVVPEATIIIEHLDQIAPEPRMVPLEPEAAIGVRLLDRIFDNYVMTPMQAQVGDAIRPADARDAHGVEQARRLLGRSYAWLDQHMTGREWAATNGFTLADCAAAPSLFYADWVQPIPATLTALKAYRARLLARPSVARCVGDARPYRHLFPLGAPERD